MLMSAIDRNASAFLYPEIVGKRVLITGLSLGHGVDLARLFADHGARLVLHMTETGAEADALLEVLARNATEVRVYAEPLAESQAAVRFTQRAAQAFGGLDAAINLVELTPDDVARAMLIEDVEDLFVDTLRTAWLVTRVAANRMRLTWTEGLILNILRMPPPREPRESAFADIMRAALAAMTRAEARQWADQAIRINAIGPRVRDGAPAAGACLTSEPEVAALALFLLTKRGRNLTGHVFDVEASQSDAEGSQPASAWELRGL
jgi:NAD(P)-dependent dehydrogenase (short-subunit alcohol dehydrogenase family)